jgi:phage terminase large subunit-like protein
LQKLRDYIGGVESGGIASCVHIKNAVRRFRSDMQRGDLIFREDKVHQVIDFISSLKHFTGAHSGKRFILEPWQLFIVANLYGFYYKNGKRRFQTAYIEVARKNGKTALSAALGLYHLMADGEDAAEVLLAANSKDQAHICYNITSKFCKGFDPEEKYLRRHRADIFFDITDSMLKVLAADSDKLDGYNCSFGIVDEYHSAPNSKVRDVIRSSQAMRDNPLLFTITTAGFEKSLPCFELRTACTEVLSGVKEDDSLFSVIYTLDDGDDWQDSANWSKANPNLGITVNADFIGKQVIQAKNNPGDEVGIKTKNLNVWCDSGITWIPDEYILSSTGKVSFDDFKGAECYGGVDLGSVQDFTALAFLFERDNKKYFKVNYYLPQEGLHSRPDKELYREWARRGYIIVTPGNVTDYEYITRDISAINDQCSIYKLAYDKWNATEWAINATNLGMPLEPFSQTVGNFNAATREMERSILAGEVIIDDNPINRFCFRNVELRSDYNGNVKPNKGLSGKKIDGVIAMIQALAMYMVRNSEVYTGSIY